MKILAVGDVHSPRYLELFIEGLKGKSLPDLFLFAGDMVLQGRIEGYRDVLNAIENEFGEIPPIVACFGNEEYFETRAKIIEEYGDHIIFLDDTSTTLEINGKVVGIVGTQGSLDEPTSWQLRNVPAIRELYLNRIVVVEEMLKQLKRVGAELTILLMHYAPTTLTCVGAKPSIYRWISSKKFYRAIVHARPTAVIHAHVHESKVFYAEINNIPIWNVALPATKTVTEIEL